MWRVGTPMQLSFDLNPHNDPHRIVGVPPVWYDPDDEYLVDLIGDFLQDESLNYLVD